MSNETKEQVDEKNILVVGSNGADSSLQSKLELLKVITALLCDVQTKDSVDFDAEVVNSPEFQKLYNIIMDLRTISSALNKGNLSKFVYSKGFVLANLKAVQSNLRHMTWQTKKIAEGDFSQSVDFLGEFSEAFNKMSLKLQQSTSKLLELASLDPLTHLPNRRSLTEYLNEIFDKSDDLCLLMIDIDHFKSVNDTFGHDVGDEVLVHVSNILSQQLRSTDFIARYGGEEFVAVLPDTTIETAQTISARILHAVREAPLTTSTDICIKLTISIGLSNKKNQKDTYKDILKRSDTALYESKKNGRDKFTIYQ